jgi:hypothetical protein
MPCISRLRLLRHWGDVTDMTPDASAFIAPTPIEGTLDEVGMGPFAWRQ